MADNEYPVDEFDRLAAARTIRGTHRRKESNLKWWLALVAIVILAPTAGWAIVNFAGSPDEGPATHAPVATGPSQSSGGKPTGDPSVAPTKPDPTDSSQPTPSKSESSTSGEESSRPVLVLNGAKVSGFAATNKSVLEKAGFTKVSTDNFEGRTPTVSTVFYPKASDAKTAKKIASELGIKSSNVVLAPSATGGDQIVVVLRTDLK